MTIIVKKGMEDKNHAIDKGYGKKSGFSRKNLTR